MDEVQCCSKCSYETQVWFKLEQLQSDKSDGIMLAKILIYKGNIPLYIEVYHPIHTTT